MHAVVSRIELREPLGEDETREAQSELERLAGSVEGLAAIHLLRVDDGHLIVLVLGDDADALERTRVELGNAFMNRFVVPHAAGPPERVVAEAIVSYERPPAG